MTDIYPDKDINITEFTLPGPNIFQKLPLPLKKRLREVDTNTRPWKTCNKCHAVPSATITLKQCIRCYKNRVMPVFYCSKECQKEHWPIHRRDCERFCLPDASAWTHGPLLARHIIRILDHWTVVYLTPLTWAAVHALVYAKAKRDQHVVVFSLRIRDLSEDPPVLWPYSITIKPSNAAHCPRNRPNVDLKGIGYFRVCLAGEFSGISAEYPIHISRTLTNPLYPDWILILLNLCLDGSKSRPIMEAKFESLLTTLDYMKLPCTVPTHLGPALPIGTEVVVTNDEHWMEDLIERDVWRHLGEENMRALIEYNLRKYGATREAPVKTRRDKYLIV